MEKLIKEWGTCDQEGRKTELTCECLLKANHSYAGKAISFATWLLYDWKVPLVPRIRDKDSSIPIQKYILATN